MCYLNRVRHFVTSRADPIFLHTYPKCSELPSHISTMPGGHIIYGLQLAIFIGCKVNIFHSCRYCVSKMSCSFLYNELIYGNEQDLVDIQCIVLLIPIL